MSTPVSVQRSCPVAAPVEVVFEAALSLPLPQLYSRRYGPMPPIVDVREQQGDFDTVGQTRLVVLADRGTMHEEVLSIDRPHQFSNRLTVLTGPFRPLVATVVESWSFQDVGGATEATWRWTLHPRTALSRPLLPVVARLWRGYARGVLAQLAAEVTGTAR